MNFILQRRPSEHGATIGRLIANGTFQCYILEDVIRPEGDPKVYGETAIPAGRYRVIVTASPKFRRDLPLLVDVPGFEGVRIHPGNWPRDTEGCLLPGRTAGEGMVGQSVAAFNDLLPLIMIAQDDADGCWIDIRNMIL